MESYVLPRAVSPMSPSTPITVALAHFDDLMDVGLNELIKRDPSLAVVAAGIEHRRIPVVLRAHRPDVAILDAGALGKLAEIRELRSRHPGTRLVFLMKDLANAECAQMLAFGASACLRTDTESRDVLNAVHLAARGLQLTSRDSSSAGRSAMAGGDLLTEREAEVLPMLQGGRTNAQIAAALHIGVETVRTHARNIYRKLGVSSRRELGAPSAFVAAPVSEAPVHKTSRAPSTGSRARRPRRGHQPHGRWSA
jgi:DNA-binding NarL/FixJ family response regulator